MVPELGHFALILALVLAMVQGVVPLAGAATGRTHWMAVARPAAWGQFLFLALAYAGLTYAFVTNDFSVTYAAQNSNSQLPLIYRISAVWGGHEGSLLLWVVMMGLWTVAVGLFSRRLPVEMVARVIGVMGLVSSGFLLFMLLTSNPFDRIWPAPMDGRDLNPLLQDPGLVIHPPMLYMGYVGFSVAFAFAVAALLGGRLDAAWARWSRPWTILAWAFLTLGIALGSWWAYYELGWGGWWFWDPVENASFIPWLVGIALMHSLAVSEKRGAFKSWTVLLAIFAFALSLLGTFLVRSGVLTSVHAFANDPARGVFILMLLGAVVGGSLFIYALRAPAVKSTGRFSLFSRETLLLGNNVLLAVAAGTILLGTLYPLVLDALGVGKISVGPPYFNAVFVPLMIPLILAMGLGPLTRWKRDRVNRLLPVLTVVLIVSAVLGALLPWWLYGEVPAMAAVGAALSFWVLLTVLLDVHHRTRNAESTVAGLRKLSPSFWGMSLAHIGVAATVIGVTFSSYFGEERDLRMAPGDSVEVAGLAFNFEGVDQRRGPNYMSNTGVVRVTDGDRQVALLETEKRVYNVQGMPMTEAGIDAGLTRDLYVAMGEQLDDSGAWALRIYHKPFVRWIWLGGLLMALGGLLAASDRRYRLSRHGTSERGENA
ncbi:heme lyase CcmF/NrfE family subunit [Thiohalomonas denitrificans]|uniref:Cytochrome c-type biogenesis protein CcmF n=1 Tax=Thiohalomonas denitrificans TaxID=415747 RepID=A0A1G5Q932_9GAMM|nr:heme lyase CcmF/NrfE family subunit [Thiohalomonas denitrificans]SCZ57980.1 cytochrome c-type biogenesis protein CcmF [Thiohalomonas denitrificans]